MSGAISATTLGIVAGVGAAGSIGGALIGSHAAGKAADTQAAAADNAAQLQYKASQDALAFQKQQWNTQQQNLAPWLHSGTDALGNLGYLLGIGSPDGSYGGATSQPGTFTSPPGQSPTGHPALPSGKPVPEAVGHVPYPPVGSAPGQSPAPAGGTTGAPGAAPNINTDLGGFGSLMQPYQGQFTAPTDITEQNDPGYQARLRLGMDAMDRSAAARGSVLTGGTAQAENQAAQDYASNEYGNVYNRAFNQFAQGYNQYEQGQTNQYNRLASLAGMGQQTAGQLSYLGNQASNSVSQNLMETAAAMGQDYQNAAAANASGYVGGANAWSGALGGTASSIQNLLLLKQLQGGGGGGALTIGANGSIISPGYV